MNRPDAATASTRHSATLSWVEGFRVPESDPARHSVDRTLDLLRHSPAPFARETYAPGHITGSGLVFAPTMDRLLLVFHNRLACWLQPGGHVEADDETVYETARREVHEETGVRVTMTAPDLIGVDVHEIPAARGEPVHLHHDLMFSMVATEEMLRGSSETRAVVWCPLGELEKYGVDQILSRNVARALNGLNSSGDTNPT